MPHPFLMIQTSAGERLTLNLSPMLPKQNAEGPEEAEPRRHWQFTNTGAARIREFLSKHEAGSLYLRQQLLILVGNTLVDAAASAHAKT
ncbi:hypothetical protein [Pseudomonas nitroreducens]|uniref:Uncharacterized protein n=1 Tax=Pseudomonas nitroreducens TaxID=46680 RepID=A0A6G6J6Y5_PSENT|nr:hypothetical protein [Pseudomonas nitroreducens]QIE91145.1 hypothetical protein G5B91_32835 [Pseudomonas nitroreducens]